MLVNGFDQIVLFKHKYIQICSSDIDLNFQMNVEYAIIGYIEGTKLFTLSLKLDLEFYRRVVTMYGMKKL